MRRSADLMAPICDALQVAHDMDIVHRDVKPANIFLHGEVPKLLDFGLAKLMGSYIVEQKITTDGWLVGTPLYMAPERFGAAQYSGRSDVYSVGVVLYQMLADRLPFEGDFEDPLALAATHANVAPLPIGDIMPDLPSRLASVVMRSLSKRSQDRPTAAEFASEIRGAVENLPAEPYDDESMRPFAQALGELPTDTVKSTPKERPVTSSPTVDLGRARKDDGTNED